VKRKNSCLLGIAGEAGELVEVIKKLHFHEMSEEEAFAKIRSEAGDVMYYFIQLLDLFRLDLDEVLEFNMNKLRERHGEQFTPGYASDSVSASATTRKIVLLYGVGEDVDAYVATLIKAKKHDREIFYAHTYNNIEILRAFAHKYETILVDATRGDAVSDGMIELEARQRYEHLGVTVEVVRLENP